VVVEFRDSPDIEALIAVGARMAHLMSIPPASDAAMRDMLEYVLFEREYWEAARDEIITHEELMNIVLDHVYMSMRPEGFDADESFLNDPEVLATVKAALFR
jgi:hypothetical protein